MMGRGWLSGLRGALLVALLFVALLPGCVGSRRHAATPDVFDVKTGREQFQSYCAACHQYDGQGVGEAPPLADSPWVTGPQERLIKIVLHGIKGEMTVHGETYDREMPGFGAILPDTRIASLLSFVRHSFGAAGHPISADDVRRVRKAHLERTQYWTVEELLTDSKP